ncbi:MAG TPA: penicillin-binding protein 1A [Longimicrobiaceae bacterium]|nr:penicillin-binding protein 1A [Longimicrobiaceae bacterium]
MARTDIKRTLVRTAAVLGGLGLLLFGWLWFAPCWLGGCAPVDDMLAYQAEGSELLDINGDPFGMLATVNRQIVSLDSLPPHVPRAFVAVEDQRFYDHGGVDFRRVIGSFITNVKAGGVEEGASTITMQLARNLFPEWLPYTERSLLRKLKEVRIARQIERRFSKDKILELYINHIYLGDGAYGIEAAAQTYFGKPASELSVTEAATLAGLPVAPSDLNPKENLEGATERRNVVLAQMADAGFISREEANAAQAEPIQLAEEEEDTTDMEAPYFIERVRREMEEIVGTRLYTGGLKIYTTLDPVAQAASEQELAQQLDAIEAGRFGTYRHETYPEASGTADESGQTPYLQGAVVVMEAASGEVRALVGGRDFTESKFNRATQALRQPGSAFKPFVYLTALERYGSPVHPVLDEPVRMTLSDGRVWSPDNYTGSYDGQMTMREALTRSKNAATVRLSQEVGIEPIVQNAHELGITSDIPEVPSAALGSASVRPIEMVRAYAAFANGGVLVEPHFIRRVEDRHGNTVWQSPGGGERVLDPSLAFVLTSMLRDVVDRGTASAVRATGFSGPAAGKTGTTNSATDVWFVGYTPELVAGIWMGMDDPQTIVRGASGGALAAPVWGRIMERIYAERPMPEPWTPPGGVITAQVQRGTGMLVDETCPVTGPTYTEYFVNSIPFSEPCIDPYGYTTLAGDTMWMDEEWAMTYDSLGAPITDGIDWPALEEIRRRLRAGTATAADSMAAYGTPPMSMQRDSLLVRDTIAAPPTVHPDTTAPPRLLGTPVRADTMVRDTTGG